MAIATIALVTSCDKEGKPSSKGGAKADYSKAEIVIEATGYEGVGEASATFFDNCTVQISGTDFDGKEISGSLSAKEPKFVVSTDKVPDTDNSYFASVCVKNVANFTETSYDVNFRLKVHCLIYNKNGDVIYDENTNMGQLEGTNSAKNINKTLEVDRNFVNHRFELAWDQNVFTKKWFYCFGWTLL